MINKISKTTASTTTPVPMVSIMTKTMDRVGKVRWEGQDEKCQALHVVPRGSVAFPGMHKLVSEQYPQVADVEAIQESQVLSKMQQSV